MNGALLGETSVGRLGKMRLDQGRAQNVARLLVGQKGIQIFVETRSASGVLKFPNGTEAPPGLDHIFAAGFRNEMPEAFTRKVIERKRDVAAPLIGYNEIPVAIEQTEETRV